MKFTIYNDHGSFQYVMVLEVYYIYIMAIEVLYIMIMEIYDIYKGSENLQCLMVMGVLRL